MTALSALGWAFYALIAWAPLAAWMSSPFGAGGRAAWRLALPTGARFESFAATLAYALAVAAVAVLAGGAAALYCWRRRGSLARAAQWTALLALPFPPYLHALAWLPLLSAIPGAGWVCAGWVELLAMLPFAFGLLRLAMENLDPRWLEAARVYGDDRRLLRRVLIPALAPAALAAFALVFLLALSDPAAPSLFSRSPYSMEIFADFSAHHDAARALWMSTPLILAGLLALEPLRRYWRAMAHRPSPRTRACAPLDVPALGAGAALAALPAAALVASLATHAWPPGAWADSLALGWRDAATSAASAAVAALVAVPAALAVSSSIARGSRAAWWAAAAPLAAPGALAGAGLIWIWNRDLAYTPYGGFFMLPLAALARFAPIAALAAAAWRMRLDPALLDAGSVYARPARRFLRIELPLMRPGLVAGALAIAAFSVAELPATLLVAPPGWGTIGVRIYNYLHYGSSASAAALSFALMAIMALAAWAAARVWRTWQ